MNTYSQLISHLSHTCDHNCDHVSKLWDPTTSPGIFKGISCVITARSQMWSHLRSHNSWITPRFFVGSQLRSQMKSHHKIWALIYGYIGYIAKTNLVNALIDIWCVSFYLYMVLLLKKMIYMYMYTSMGNSIGVSSMFLCACTWARLIGILAIFTICKKRK